MKKLKLTELEQQANLDKLSNSDKCSIVGAGCWCCCEETTRSWRKRSKSGKLTEPPGNLG